MKTLNLKIQKKINSKWRDIYYNKTNNFENFKYNNLNKFLFKSKKITRNI